MKKFILLLAAVMLAVLPSCEKGDGVTTKFDGSYFEYLSDKAVTSIKIFDGDIWIESLKVCDTCEVEPWRSYLPMIHQLTVISDLQKEKGYDYDEPSNVSIPSANSKGVLYVSSRKNINPGTGNKLYKVNRVGDYQLVLDTEDFFFHNFIIDKDDNFWLACGSGIATWDGNELRVYTPENSLLSSEITHGMVVDHDNVVWIAQDKEGILKIKDGVWSVIPYSGIPGLSGTPYMHSPVVDKDNSVWFRVFGIETGSRILRYDDTGWTWVYPPVSPLHGHINADQSGTVWVYHNEFTYEGFESTTLAWYDGGDWVDFDVTSLSSFIISVNADAGKLYIGTGAGLTILDR
jgi:hypothetical protein